MNVKNNLNQMNFYKIGMFLLHVFVATFVTQLLQIGLNTNFGTYTPFIWMVFGLLSKGIQEYLSGDSVDTTIKTFNPPIPTTVTTNENSVTVPVA